MFFFYWLLLAAICHAIEITNGIIGLDSGAHEFGEATPIVLQATDREIELSFQLELEGGSVVQPPVPHQVAIIVGSEQLSGSKYLYPSWHSGSKSYDFKISVPKLSPYLKTQDELTLKVLLGDTDSVNNKIATVATVVLPDTIKQAVNVELPERFGPKPEIFHIFRQDPQQAPAAICQLFAAAASVIFFGLIFFWNTQDAVNLDNISKLTPLALPFVALLALIEAIFYSYYLGSSIFTTLDRLAIVGAATVYLGYKVLQSMYLVRTKQ